MQDLAQHIRMEPDKRKREIQDFAQAVNQSQEVKTV